MTEKYPKRLCALGHHFTMFCELEVCLEYPIILYFEMGHFDTAYTVLAGVPPLKVFHESSKTFLT